MKQLLLVLVLAFAGGAAMAQTEGDVFFSGPTVHTIKLSFSYSNYVDSLEWSYTNDTYIHGDVEVDGTLYANCGLKYKGNSSYNGPLPKKSIKIDFNEFVSGQDHDGLKKLNLNNGFKDPTFLREKLALDFYAEHGVPAPRASFAEVHINGSLWGFYSVIEEVDKTFLSRWFNDDKGNLYKGDPTGDLKYLGTTQSTYESKYELKTNETLNDWSSLLHFIDILNNTPSGSYQDSLDNVFDSQKFLYAWAIELLFANLDSYTGSGHNYYLYHDSLTGKMQFIPWDVNESFGVFAQGMTVSQLEGLSLDYNCNTNRPLHANMWKYGYDDDLKAVVCELLNYDWSIYTLEAKIDNLAELIRPYVYADPNKMYSDSQFETNLESNVTSGGPMGGNIPGLKSFLRNRRDSLTLELAAFGCIVGINEESSMLTGLQCFPNPTNDVIFVSGLPAGATIELLDLSGKLLRRFNTDESQTSIDLSTLQVGIYLLRATSPDGENQLTRVVKN